MIERLIGIDFGTSSTAIKVKTYEDGKPMDAENAVHYVSFDGKYILPTLVYQTNAGDCLIGYNAQNPSVKGSLHQNFKLDLVSTDDGLKKRAVQYTEMFFQYMYKVYNEQRNQFATCDTETTFISYPVKWPEELQALMRKIAADAGFVNVQGLDEASAAIHTVMVQDRERLVLGGDDYANILMIDMGAGTTDLVLCEYSPYEEKHIRFLSTWPQAGTGSFFGGREIDYWLCGYVKGYLAECGLKNLDNFEEKNLDKSKTWKETNVSPTFENKDGVVKYCGFADAIVSMLDIDEEFPPLTKDGFEDILADYLTQFAKLINDCLAAANFDPAQLDYVILTGGHSQWYFTDEILSGKTVKFGEVTLPKIMADDKRIIKLKRPQETVALGLVFHRISIHWEDRPSVKVTGILNILAGRYIKKFGVDLMADSTALKRLEAAAKNAVTDIEKDGRAEIAVPYISATRSGPLNMKEIITKEELSEYIEQYSRPEPISDPEPEKPVTPKIPADKSFCGYCGKPNPKNSKFCGYCGKDIEKAAEINSYISNTKPRPNIAGTGNLIKTFGGFAYYRGIQPFSGTFYVYDNKTSFKASALNMLGAAGASHDILMADIVSAQRHKAMGFIESCVKISTLQGKEYVYSVGLYNKENINEIIDLISTYKGG